MSDRYLRAKEIFLLVCDLPAEQRSPIIERECAGDEALRREVHSLLAHHDRDEQRNKGKRLEDLETAPRSPRPGSADAGGGSENFAVESGAPDPKPERIGAYRIARRLGVGGMGIVYLAQRDDDQFRKRVAIKVIKKGMDSEEILRRFEQERQVLSALNHPNIARMLDGGATEDGRPYFVMEYIEGMPITEYCEKNRLRIDERLNLFRTLCQAVHHAHQNLIVHRDIKPTNVVVTQDGTLKLLDFGIAKLLNPELAVFAKEPTATNLRLMTPEYASPEQVRGDPLSTASDVYSLGVLMYELVTGRRPYRFKTRLQSEIERVICEEDPERPSTAITHPPPEEEEAMAVVMGDPSKPSSRRTQSGISTSKSMGEAKPERLRRRLSGDIDNIVLMAMRKEPKRRYASAEQFAEDIRRHLDGMPVMARAATWPYRAGKFVLRNKGAVAAAAVIALAVIGWAVTATWLQRVAVRNEQLANAARDEADAQRRIVETIQVLTAETTRALDTTLQAVGTVGIPTDRTETQLTPTEARANIAEQARDFLNRFTAISNRPINERDLASAYMQLGDIHGGPRNPNLGQPAKALENYRAGLEILTRLAAKNPADTQTRIELARCHLKIGDLRKADDRARAAEHYKTALSIAETARTQHAGFSDLDRMIANVSLSLGDLHQAGNDKARAGEAWEKARQLREQFYRANLDDPRAARELSVVLVRLADLQQEEGKVAEAQTQFQRVIDLRAELVARDAKNRMLRRDLAMAYFWAGQNQRVAGEWASATEQLGQAKRLLDELRAEDDADTRVQRDLGVCLRLLGDVAYAEILAAGENAKLDEMAQRAREHYTSAARALEGLRSSSAKESLAFVHRYWAEVERIAGDHAGARRHYEEAITLFRDLAATRSDLLAKVDEITDAMAKLPM